MGRKRPFITLGVRIKEIVLFEICGVKDPKVIKQL
jgi:hypothetical protein